MILGSLAFTISLTSFTWEGWTFRRTSAATNSSTCPLWGL